ncbi:exo-alpha-sialidase [Streptomyces sp. MUM 203J]|uniref:F510_1955 family glycosylhydrolase n=1 Tax=Streptomyces sp. MUM 203J TaxID=2791990 RepID=UPI001F03E72A|nr:exo-alpha-sialidase [Streptomyces sp. MUM 203J]MCH0540855.1 exo-alpha-sialidase [Streptomyces sp. MUM 203J]
MHATTRTRVALGTAALALALTACSTAATAPAADRAGDTTAADPHTTPIRHVHGLGLDPSDQRLYVASHDGIFTTGEDGAPERVGDSEDDFMGFAVTGPKTFLASGHSAPGSGGPGHHGLIESTDSGRTWKPRSLGGEADFHALEQARGILYGYDSTTGLLRVSEDGAAWDDRARLQALDIAVDPDSPGTVLATTPDGVAKSTDGGRTFGSGRQPAMAFLSWPAADALYGLDDFGGLHRSTDGGATWKKAGTVPGGQSQALTAVDAQHVLAATQDGVYESTDGGATFARRLPVHAGDGH